MTRRDWLRSAAALAAWAVSSRADEATIEVPALDGDWWRIAPNAPEVGEWATGQENACDFTIFPVADGKWHCIACIRGTKAPGQRLFFRWEADRLTDVDWRPLGILDVPRGGRGGAPTSVQAPHAVRVGDRWHLFYNTGGECRCLISDDGRAWTPWPAPGGGPSLFTMGRDVMLFHDQARSRWIAYYCGRAQGQPRDVMAARTARELSGPWSDPAVGARTDGNPESPFVLRRGEHYYLWQQMSVYRSGDPLQFDAPIVAHLTGLWFNGKFAPEVVTDGEQPYVAGYSRGLWLAKMKWQRKSAAEVDDWRRKWEAYLAEQERLRQERLRQERERNRTGGG